MKTVKNLLLVILICLTPLSGKADWPTKIWTQVRANSVIADITGDGKNEVVIATMAKDNISKVYVLDDSGRNLPGWPKSFFEDQSNSMINNMGLAVADFNGDGKQEICFSSGFGGPGKIHLLNFKGEYLPGWPVTLDEKSKNVALAPVIADVDNDGKNEIIVGTCRPDAFYAYKVDGTIVNGWPRLVFGDGCGVIVGDFNNDKDNEIIAWTSGQRFYGWKADGTILSTKNLGAFGNLSDCIVADIDNDGKYEIVAATDKGKVFIWDALTLTPYKGWAVPRELGNGFCNLSLADLDKDGKLDIIVNFVHKDKNEQGLICIYKADGSTFHGWPQKLVSSHIYGELVVADLDGDSLFEIMGVSVNGELHVWRSDGKYYEGYPQMPFGKKTTIFASPVLGDIKGNSCIDALITPYVKNNKAFLKAFDGPCEAKTILWTRHGYNNHNNRFLINNSVKE